MSMTRDHRPFGVSLISILLIIAGVLDLAGGLVFMTDRSDDLMDALDVSSGDVTAYGVVAVIFGVVVVFVGSALYRGANWARYLVGIVAAGRLIALVWGVIAYHQIQWYEALWPVAFYLLVARYLFFDDDAKRYYGQAA